MTQNIIKYLDKNNLTQYISESEILINTTFTKIKKCISDSKLISSLTLDEWNFILSVDFYVKTPEDNEKIFDFINQIPPIELFNKFNLYKNPYVLNKLIQIYKYKSINEYNNIIVENVSWIYNMKNPFTSEIYNDVKYLICNIIDVNVFIDLNNPRDKINEISWKYLFIYLYTYKGDHIINSYIRESEILRLDKQYNYGELYQLCIKMKSKYSISEDKEFYDKWIKVLNEECTEPLTEDIILYRGQINNILHNKGFISLTANYDTSICSDFIGEEKQGQTNNESCVIIYHFNKGFPLIKVDHKENLICRNIKHVPIEYEYIIPSISNISYTLINHHIKDAFPYNHYEYNVNI